MIRKLWNGGLVRNGISGASVPLQLVYAGDVNAATLKESFYPLLTYAIAEVETIEGERAGQWDAATIVASDGGTGLMQITPEEWWTSEMNYEWSSINRTNPHDNCVFGVQFFLVPAEEFWVGNYAFEGNDLIRAIAAEYNAGRGLALQGHNEGDIGKYTKHQGALSYPDHVLQNYTALMGIAPSA
jgi:hypothetical protein